MGEIGHAEVAPEASAQFVVGEATACLPLGALIDLTAEAARLEKAIAKANSEAERIRGKLANEKFVANAKADVVEAERERLAELDQQLSSLGIALARVVEAG